jgi:conjugal transfer pilus assembly protein TraK
MIAACEIASGVSLLSSLDCFAKRCCGTALLAAGLVAAEPALADQTVIAADNGSVQCDASKQDLTRISLRDDRFAAVSKVASAVAAEDFSVVHEPTRRGISDFVTHACARICRNISGSACFMIFSWVRRTPQMS